MITRVIYCQDKRMRALEEVATESQLNAFSFDQELRERIRVEANRDCEWIYSLQDVGLKVHLFDGYEDDLVTQIRDPAKGGAKLKSLIVESGAECLVYDLHYFNDFEYGMEMLRFLKNSGVLHNLERKLVLSWFVDEPRRDYPARLISDFGFDPGSIFYALKYKPKDIVKIVQGTSS